MRVLQINTVFNRASTGKIAAVIQSGLLAGGHESAVAYGRYPIQGPNLYRIGWGWEVYLHVLQARLTGLSGCSSVLGTTLLKRYISAFKPDVVHLHNIHGYYVHCYNLLEHLKRENIPVVWTLHDCWPFTGHCAYYEDCEKWICGCGDCPKIKTYPNSWFFDRSAEEYEQKKRSINALSKLILVTPSGWLASAVRRSFLQEKPVRVIYNGIDTKKIFYPRDRIEARRKLGISSGNSVLLALSDDFTEIRKGAKYIIELAKLLLGKKVSIVMVGVKGQCEGLPANVIALPATNNQDELAEYYSAADVFCITSVSDNFPTVVLEAAACGAPTIGFQVGGIPEQLSLGIGECVPPFDILALHNAAMGVFDNPSKYSREACRALAVKHFDRTVMLNNYISLYREAMGCFQKKF